MSMYIPMDVYNLNFDILSFDILSFDILSFDILYINKRTQHRISFIKGFDVKQICFELVSELCTKNTHSIHF
jgi:hypothetical protein